jgi:hypothetical protein
MNQTLSEKLYVTRDETCAPKSPSISSKPKSSGSFKAGDKKQKTGDSSTETLEEKEKRRRVRKDKKHKRKEKESKSKYSTETPEEKAQRRSEEKNENKNDKKESKDKESEDSNLQKGDDKAEQRQQKLDIAEKLQCKSLGSNNVTQAADIDSYRSDDDDDDDNMNMSVMVVPHWGQQVKSSSQHQQENSGGWLTYDDAGVFTQETVLPNENESLMCMVKTLRRRLEEVESENRQLTEMNSAYSTQLEEQLAYRKELNGVQEEVEQLRHQRDEAIYRAGELTIESGKVSESYDRVAESKVVIEQMRRMIQTSLTQQSTSASVRGVSKKLDRRSGMSSFSALPISLGFRKLGSLLRFRNKNDDKTLVSTYDDDCMLDPTEDNTSVGSEDLSDLERTLFDLERTDFAEPHSSVAFFSDNLNCSSDQLHNRRLLRMDVMLDPPKNKKKD